MATPTRRKVTPRKSASYSKRTDKITEHVRARLLTLRKARQMTDAAWARNARLTQQEVSRFSRGRMRFPPLDFLDALCRVMGVTLADVIADEIPAFTPDKRMQKIIDVLEALDDVARANFEQLILNYRPQLRRG